MSEHPISVNVFSSAKNSPGTRGNDATGEQRENNRAKTVSDSLEPSLAYCWSISLDRLVYQFSLPSLVQILAQRLPELTWLILGCHIYDLDDETNDIEVDCYLQLRAGRVPSFQPSFLMKTSYPALCNTSNFWAISLLFHLFFHRPICRMARHPYR